MSLVRDGKAFTCRSPPPALIYQADEPVHSRVFPRPVLPACDLEGKQEFVVAGIDDHDEHPAGVDGRDLASVPHPTIMANGSSSTVAGRHLPATTVKPAEPTSRLALHAALGNAEFGKSMLLDA